MAGIPVTTVVDVIPLLLLVYCSDCGMENNSDLTAVVLAAVAVMRGTI